MHTKRIRKWVPFLIRKWVLLEYYENIDPTHSHFYAACTSRHQSSMIPKALKFATLQKKMAPIPPHT